MRLLLAALILTLALAATASVFAIWPVVADAPWEQSAQPQPTEDRTQEIRCEAALQLREAVIQASTTQRGLYLLPEAKRQMDKAEREIARYC